MRVVLDNSDSVSCRFDIVFYSMDCTVLVQVDICGCEGGATEKWYMISQCPSGIISSAMEAK